MKWIKANMWTLLLVTAILGVCVYSIGTAYSLRQQNISSSSNDSDLFLNIIIGNQKRQLENDGEKINDILCYSESGDSIRISELLGGKELVVLYGGSNYCNSCIDYHIQTINDLKQKELSNVNVILLFKGISQRNLQIIKETNNLRFPLYAVISDLKLPVEEDEDPVLFVIRPDLLIVNTFYPLKTKVRYNDIFYKVVSSMQ